MLTLLLLIHGLVVELGLAFNLLGLVLQSKLTHLLFPRKGYLSYLVLGGVLWNVGC